MTASEFRHMALSFPETSERAHMGHPDFRVCGKIFATLMYPDKSWGMVKLTPEQQAEFVHDEPEVFVPVTGGWGRKGATSVRLKAAKKKALRLALMTAWRNAAPKQLVTHLRTAPRLAAGSVSAREFDSLVKDLSHVRAGRHSSRDEMNER